MTTYRVSVIDHQKFMKSMDVTFDDNSYPGTDDNEESESEEKNHPNEEPTNSEGNSGKKENKEQRKELLLEKSLLIKDSGMLTIMLLLLGSWLKLRNSGCPLTS